MDCADDTLSFCLDTLNAVRARGRCSRVIAATLTRDKRGEGLNECFAEHGKAAEAHHRSFYHVLITPFVS